MKVLKCENCGAPITPDAVGCEYCGASFYLSYDEDKLSETKRVVEDVGTITEMNKLIQQANGILTPNETRGYLGLESIRDDVRCFHDEIKYIREGPNVCGVYDTYGNRIKTLVM